MHSGTFYQPSGYLPTHFVLEFLDWLFYSLVNLDHQLSVSDFKIRVKDITLTIMLIICRKTMSLSFDLKVHSSSLWVAKHDNDKTIHT